MTRNLRIAIVGGGIGGLTTALALQQRGFTAHVYEAVPALRPAGKGIWVPTNAMLVLDQLGIGGAVAARGVALEAIEVHDVVQGRLQSIDLKPLRRRTGRTTISIRRADLQAALADALQPGTLHLGRRCRGATSTPDAAIVAFSDGSAVSADLIIGADGIRSTVRNAIAPGSSPRYAGQTCYLGIADMALPAFAATTVREIWGGRSRFGYSAVGPSTVYWFAPLTAPPNGSAEPDLAASLARRYAHFPAPVPALLAQTPPASIVRVDLSDLRPLRRWHRERLVLVGDAAHAMTPNLGQGGAQAIEDGYVLAACLASTPDVATALRAYTTRRRPRTRQLASTARRLGRLAHLSHPIGRALRNVAMRWAPPSLAQRRFEAVQTPTLPSIRPRRQESNP